MSQKMSNALKQGDNTPVVLVGSSNLEVREVEFLGDSILAVKEDEKVYAGVGYICKGLGLSEGQMKNERKKIQEDIVLQKGGRNFVLATNYGDKETLCINLDYLPIWLAKISITPKMKEQQPKVVERLVEYQLKAKDVLAQAFIHKSDIDISRYSPEMQAILMHDEKLIKVENRVNKLENNMTLDYGQQNTIQNLVNKRATEVLGGKTSMAYKLLSKKTFPEIYRALKNSFQVPSYKDIPVVQFEKAKEMVLKWTPSQELNLMIIGANAQVSPNIQD